MKKHLIPILFFFIIGSNAQEEKMSFQDKNHTSQVFESEKSYRLYLPSGYEENKKEYPVIYFFHGWGGRYFKDDNALLEYQKIGKLVDEYQVILVMWDGNIIEDEPRPYNIGCPEDIRFEVQMKDYFLELVSHIDATYTTKKDRESRAIIGYSMGGIMSYFISGKYPHLISSAVNMTGSPEFYFGYPENHTLYPLRYTFTNLSDVRTRFHNSSVGELSDLNREVHFGALWQGDMDYEYWEFSGGHKVDEKGETRAFGKAMEFVNAAFKKPKPKNAKWSHLDLYSKFDLWGYELSSNKTSSGFIYLKNVSKKGFGLYTKKWLPISPSINDFMATLKTAPIYLPEKEYQIQHYKYKEGVVVSKTSKSDGYGRLRFQLDGTGHQIGIYEKDATLSRNVAFIKYTLPDNKRLVHVGDDNEMTLTFADLGIRPDPNEKISISLRSTDGSIATDKEFYALSSTNKNRILVSESIHLTCSKNAPLDGAPFSVKFVVEISTGTEIITEKFDVPVFFEVPEFKDILIDDGKLVKDAIFGKGNGDGTASSGEQIMVYTSENRTQLFYDDPYISVVNEEQYLENLPGKWTCDGTTASSVIKIAQDCPENYKVEILAKYETKDFMPIRRRSHWGKITLILNPLKK